MRSPLYLVLSLLPSDIVLPPTVNYATSARRSGPSLDMKQEAEQKMRSARLAWWRCQTRQRAYQFDTALNSRKPNPFVKEINMLKLNYLSFTGLIVTAYFAVLVGTPKSGEEVATTGVTVIHHELRWLTNVNVGVSKNVTIDRVFTDHHNVKIVYDDLIPVDTLVGPGWRPHTSTTTNNKEIKWFSKRTIISTLECWQKTRAVIIHSEWPNVMQSRPRRTRSQTTT